MQKRSLNQNSYYHGVIVRDATDFYNSDNAAKMADDMRIFGIADDDIKEFKFVPTKRVTFTTTQIHEHIKLLFNDGKTTTKLLNRTKDAKEEDEAFEVFTFNIREHFYHAWSLRIPTPNEVPLEEYFN